MSDAASAYRDLARVLDSMPQGYPATDSGVEILILERLFAPEEAAVARWLTMRLETPDSVAGRAGLEKDAARSALKSMVKKGLIEAGKAPGGIGYRLMPFVVGFYENQGPVIDAEFAELFERYYAESRGAIVTMRPSAHRVIPVERSLGAGAEVMPYERASAYVDAAASWGVLPCICRTQKRLVGKGCHHSVDNCLMLSPRPDAFARSDFVKALTREGALEVLRAAAAEGLVHTTANSQAGITYICNCCTCSCGFLRAAREFGVTEPVSRSHYLAAVDSGACTGCATCVAACQFGALAMGGGAVCGVEAARCIGCGLCVQACPSAALSLRRKDGAALEAPPITEGDWEAVRALHRGLEEEYARLKG